MMADSRASLRVLLGILLVYLSVQIGTIRAGLWSTFKAWQDILRNECETVQIENSVCLSNNMDLVCWEGKQSKL